MSVICKIHAQLIDNVTALGGEIKRLISLDNQKVYGMVRLYMMYRALC